LPLLPGKEELGQPVTLAAGNGLWVKARAADQVDWTWIFVREATVLGPLVEITLNRTYLLRALRFGLHRIELGDSLGPLLFKAPGKMMIVMPLRAQEPMESHTEPTQECSQIEKATAAPPSATEAQTPTEQRIPVSTETPTPTSTPLTTPNRSNRGNVRAHTNGGNGQEQSGEVRPGFKVLVDHIDQIKTDLRDVIGELNETQALLKTADKEQRATAKEVEAIRAKLREIQNVEI